MAGVEFKISGLEEVRKYVDKLPDEVLVAVRDSMFAIANTMRNNIILAMRSTPKAPWSYRRGGKIHNPSMPYHAPAIDSGNLINNLIIDRTGKNKVRMGTNINEPPYPFFLEEGTVKMAERPWMEPEIEKMDFEKEVISAITRSVDI